jgi:hypothetical protein
MVFDPHTFGVPQCNILKISFLRHILASSSHCQLPLQCANSSTVRRGAGGCELVFLSPSTTEHSVSVLPLFETPVIRNKSLPITSCRNARELEVYSYEITSCGCVQTAAYDETGSMSIWDVLRMGSSGGRWRNGKHERMRHLADVFKWWQVSKREAWAYETSWGWVQAAADAETGSMSAWDVLRMCSSGGSCRNVKHKRMRRLADVFKWWQMPKREA